MTLQFTDAIRNAWLTTISTAVDAGAGAGKIRFYTGGPPANVAAAATGTLLADATLPDPSFGSPSAGVITLNNPASVNASATGTCGWWRALDSTNAGVMQGTFTATGGGGDMTGSTTSFVSGQAVDITSGGTITAPGG